MEMGRDQKLDIGSAGLLRKLRRRSFEMNLESQGHGKMIKRTQSLGSQILVNVDERYSISKPSSNDGLRRFPFSLAAEDMCDHISLRVQSQSPKRTQCIATEEEATDVAEGRSFRTPTLPICLKFQDVKYKVAAKGVKSPNGNCILQGVTGSVQPGEILALMGPSGGGKTTLLNVLSGRAKLNSGIITYNDQPYTKSLKQRIGYVMQDEILFPHLTVKETLTYAALLRLPITLTKNQKKERAMHVINELGLERCQDTVIGGTFVRGVSGGERKRVCIGNEILLNPSLLFLDEPTSGLDSTAAFRILQMLHIIAEAGKTVVTTIHQPSSRIFSKFDKLILLGKGSSLYFGEASKAMMYFSSIGCTPNIAMNPAEFLIDLANGNTNHKTLPTNLEDGGPSTADVHEYLIEANQERLTKMNNKRILTAILIDHGEYQMNGRSYSNESRATWWEQFSILFTRGLKERRHEYFSCMRVIQVISTAVIIGLLWWHSNASSLEQLHDQAGLLFFISVFWAFFPIFSAIFTFPQERAILAKERSVEMYKLSSYFLARNISDLPLDLLLPIVFLLIVYMMVGLKRTFAAFFETMLTIFLSIVAAQGLGLSIGAAFIDVKKATTLASVIVMTFMLSGGFFIQKVPSVISWVRYISFNYHTYRLLLKVQYSCSGSDLRTAGYESCESPFIKELKLDSGGMEVGAMVIMIIGYRVLAYILLRTMKLRTTI